MCSREYSRRLGTLSDGQFQAALDRFDLGRFVRAEPISFGNWGQNCFLTSTRGEHVLRGAPFFPWQFAAERLFAREIHRQTTVPVPWPYLVDDSRAIFGWPYTLMPRLPGVQLADPSIRAGLSSAEQIAVAGALGEGLARLHQCIWPSAGAYDPNRDSITPGVVYAPISRYIFPSDDYRDPGVVGHIRRMLARSQIAAPDQTTAADAEWVEALIEQTEGALAEQPDPCLVMGDYKEDNVVVDVGSDGIWRVVGVFDLMGCWFGDGEADLSRQTAMYLGRDHPELASAFLRSYFDRRPLRPGFASRFRLYMLAERISIWELVKRERFSGWIEPATLREWASQFTEANPLR